MAYAALVSLANTIEIILNHHQDFISPRVKNQIIYIQKYVSLLQVLPEVHFPVEANNLEPRIREVTHKAEDAIECLSYEASFRSAIGESKSNGKHQRSRKWEQMQPRNVLVRLNVGSSRSMVKPQPRRKKEQLYDDVQVLEKVIKEIEAIVEEVKFKRGENAQLGGSTAASSSSSADPLQKDAMVGFDNDLMVIKSRLCGESSELEVVPIVGMGGIGKTTLARNIYDDSLIVEHFDIRVWVTISQDYSVDKIVSSLLGSMEVLGMNTEPMKELKVYQKLKGRRYLVILDDIWSAKAWDDLTMIFPNDGNGSRILLTTRLLDVACYANSRSRIHEMHLMDEDQSWNLLRQKVFKQSPCPFKLEYVGKKIARSCRGLPLAIVVISGLLSAAGQTKAAWESIAKDVKHAISTNDEQLDKILSLSYTHLPYHLRPCFLYMGFFPEDYEMRVSQLIRLWVAECFLEPDGCNGSFEKTAEKYLEDLVKRCLVFVTKRKSNGRIKSFSIHDLMREMCIKKAGEENFFYSTIQWKAPRRVSIFHLHLSYYVGLFSSRIDTIIGAKHTGFSYLHYFRQLKILHLINVHKLYPERELSSLPVEIFDLFLLRYLALDHTFRITTAISNLQNLQTLIIGSRKYHAHETQCFVQLPTQIWMIQQLRHLILFCHLLPI